MANTTPRIGAASKLRQMLQDEGTIIVAPGVFDGLSARAALTVGFDCLYMTGAGTCASKLGQPDLGLATLNDMSEHAETLANLDDRVPLIADADTGYGGANMVARTVEKYARAGVAGLHIEDQVQMKRCGHLGGKDVVSREVFSQRIRAAYAARLRIGSDIVLIARTDTLQTHDYAEALTRLRLAFDAGADVAFLEGIVSHEQAKQICHDLAPKPVLLNMVEHGATPSMTPDQARDYGFRIIIFPFAAIFAAQEAIKEALTRLKSSGKTDLGLDFTPKRLFESVGLGKAKAVDREAGASALHVI